MIDLIGPLNTQISQLIAAEDAQFKQLRGSYTVDAKSLSENFRPDPFFRVDEIAAIEPDKARVRADHPFKVTINAGNAVVSPNSYVLGSDSPTSAIIITGLNTPISVSEGDLIWLEITFGTWPSVSSVEVLAGSPPSSMIESISGVQSVGRKPIAQIVGDGSGGLTVVQLMTTNQILRLMCIGGLAVYHPPTL